MTLRVPTEGEIFRAGDVVSVGVEVLHPRSSHFGIRLDEAGGVVVQFFNVNLFRGKD